jgi:peroxiredoxin
MRNKSVLSRVASEMPYVALLLSIATVGLASAAVRADDQPAAAPSSAVLHLTDGSFIPGDLDDSNKPGVFRWQASAFVSPFEFPVNRVNAIHWPPPAAIAKPEGDYCFELAGGDMLFGTLLALDDKQAVLDIPRFGRLQVERSTVHRIYRWRGSADLVYLGPNGLAGWTETVSPRGATNFTANFDVNMRRPPGGQRITPEAAPPPIGWHEESGQLATDREGASIQGNFNIPAKAAIEFEISWKTKPDFVFALGIDDKDVGTVKRAFRFEAWGSDLVIQRELESEADLAVVQEISPGPGRAHLQAYLDQEAGRIVVCSQGGRQLASLKVGGPRSKPLRGLYLANLRGDLRLEWLRIGQWSGELPREVNVNHSRIHGADGSIIYGQVIRFDSSTGEFVMKGDSGESRIAQDKISGVFLSLPGDDKPRAVRAVYEDGTRLSGDLERVEKRLLVMKVPGFSLPAKLPMSGLRSLVMMRHPNAPPLAKSDITGRLELDGLRLPGRLVDGSAEAGASCLVWQPLASDAASALKPGVSGRIIYREPPPPAPPRAQIQNQGMVFIAPQQAQPPGAGAMVMRFAQALAESPPEMASTTEERRSLYLRDGDVIPSVITKIDADGVWFKTSLSKSIFVAHAKVKAVELAAEPPNGSDVIKLLKSKRERLLTLPRMQKADPPTHLIRSKNGDYLRGRVAKMDAKTLEIEIRLENKNVPRERISRIIWLHADELDETKKPAAPTSEGLSTRVQALRNDGVRLTFQADQFTGTTLSGKSDVLGSCQVAVSQVDQLLIGNAIEQVAARSDYGQWKLKNAPEPKYVTAADGADGAGGDSGTESPLVGNPAPDFTLDLVDGKPWHLADSKGKEVVVLDFWATWCGPCLQAMPQVERAVGQFKDQNVRLVAVNLQETAAQVTALLERQKLHVTVALDRDGAVADKYKAVAIPQTVIIGRDGNVARLFVGGGPHLEEQLKEAIKAVLGGGDQPNEKKPR